MLPYRTVRRTGIAHEVQRRLWAGLLVFYCLPSHAQSELRLQFASASTSIKFTIADILHTIHGSFQLKQGEISYGVRSNTVRGALVIDATSGRSGNRFRDHRMHHIVLESARYPEIVFRPDRVDGTVAPAGTSNVQVHGTFSVHGADHELTLPVRVQMFSDHWVADTHFNVPYVRWGMKNPSSMLLRVSESVEVEVHAAGSHPFPASGSH